MTRQTWTAFVSAFVFVGLAILLLMVVFRSILVPLKAVVMNLLASAAAFGDACGARLRRASICWPPEPMTCVTPASSTTNSTINDVLPTLNLVSEIGVRTV